VVKARVIILTQRERAELTRIIGRRRAHAGLVSRARIVLLSADGVRATEIAERVGVSKEQVSRIRARWELERVNGLYEKKKAGRKDHALPVDLVHRIVQLAMSPPPAGRTRWTARLLAKAVACSPSSVLRTLRAHALKPHRTRTYKVSRDPDFVEKVEDVVGLYLNPPAHAIVLSLDEKTQIQALERTQLPLPLRTGRAVRHTHDYKRNGVVDLYAALEVATGRVTHACTDSHTAADFLGFLKKVARAYPRKELHVILDNSSAHSTPDIIAWLEKHPRIHFHYTPTSASWLNQVEGFFGILTKQALSLIDFPSKADLRRHLDDYLASWNQNPTPFIWTKPAKGIIRSHRRMLDRISGAVH